VASESIAVREDTHYGGASAGESRPAVPGALTPLPFSPAPAQAPARETFRIRRGPYAAPAPMSISGPGRCAMRPGWFRVALCEYRAGSSKRPGVSTKIQPGGAGSMARPNLRW